MIQTPLKIPQKIGFFILLTFIILGAALTISSPLYANGLINVVIPVLILIFFKSDFFEKLKLSTLAIGRFLVVLTVWGLLPGNLLVQMIVWLLRLNILEAALTDYKKKSYFNVASGLVLIGTSFIITGSWLGKYYLITTPSMIYWILAYTLWNWNFVIHEFNHQIGFYHLAVLAAPLIMITIAAEPGLWLIARANTLTFAGIFQITGKGYIEAYLSNPSLAGKIKGIKGRQIQLLFMTVNVVLCFISVLLQK